MAMEQNIQKAQKRALTVDIEPHRYQISDNSQYVTSPPLSQKKHFRSKSEPAQKPKSPKKLQQKREQSRTFDFVNICDLRLTADDFEKIECKYNEKMSQLMPEANSKLYVCDNPYFKLQSKNNYIVIKEMNKSTLQMGELSECEIDVKVHAHLLHHKLAVINLLGWFEDEKRFCTLYEYAEHGDLLETLNSLRNPFDTKWFDKARSEIRRIAETLQYMHSKGWTHKDLTLENILVDDERNFYLHDFALVEEFDEFEDNQKLKYRRHSSIWSGKIEHMSPENYDTFIGEIDIFDAFSNDIWGFGIILLCCFSTESFLWMAPDKKSSNYRHIMNNISNSLHRALKIKMQKNKRMKSDLMLLADLLQKIFVDEEKRIDIDEVLEHDFFSNLDESKCKPIAIKSGFCLPRCTIL